MRLGLPQLNSSGQVSFKARLTGEGVTDGNAEGIWSEGGGTLHLVTRAGDLHTIPDAPNPGRLVRFDDHWFSDAGVVLLRGSPSASVLTNQYSYWTSAEPGINYVVRSPGPASGAGTGVNFESFQGTVFNVSGQMMFRAMLSGASVSSANDTGFWYFDGTAINLIAREGDSAPGLSNRRFAESPVDVALNDSGQFAFVASTRNNAGGSPAAHLWSNRGGTLQQLFAVGGGSLSLPQINDRGHVAFIERGVNPGAGSVLLRAEYAPSSFRTVAGSGQIAFGTSSGERFEGFTRLAFNNADQVAFLATLSGPTVATWNDEGLWVERGGTRSLIARTGDEAPLPGLLSQPVYLNGFTGLTHNARGQVAFLGELSFRQQENANAGDGLYVFDLDGQLKTIAQTGMEIDVDNGPGIDLRVINTLGFSQFGTGNGDGDPTAFNDRGQIAFWAFFTDGSYAVLVSNVVAVPEPPSLPVTAAVILLSTARCQRNQRSWRLQA
jgi:hypothetical protein